MTGDRLRVRWLGRTPYREALAVQQALFENGREHHLLLLEHDHVFTYGRHADLANNLRCDPAAVGADLVAVRRGGDITYHGPGQLVGYPIVNARGSLRHVRALETLLIEALVEVGLPSVGRLAEYPGVWVDVDGAAPRKIAAIGVRVARGRTMHGFALNNTTDLAFMREHIVACGIGDRPVTSLAEEGVDIDMRELADVIVEQAGRHLLSDRSLHVERQDVAWKMRPGDLAPFSRGAGPGERSGARLYPAGLGEGLAITSRKPEWLRPKVRLGEAMLTTRKTIRDLDLVTVCEDAGCPNLSECWSQGTATFMVLGDRCTRACGFCLVDTRKPLPPSPDEAWRVAQAIERMGLEYAVLTMVARDDLADGGMGFVADCVNAIRTVSPGVRVETLVSDARGSSSSLSALFAARPDVFNHNLETVARLQRAVRPSAGYARSLAVLAFARAAGLVTKSSLMVGIGETDAEIEGALADLAGVGCDIVTIGQYLRPTSHHLPVARWVEPYRFDEWKRLGESLGIGHVEASPLTRSSYHAREAAHAAAPVSVAIGARSGS